MARACSVCTHPNRAAIDEALAANRGSFRGVSRQHGLSPDAVERHAKAHLPKAIVLATAAAEVTRADDLLSILREAVADARRLRAKAEGEGDYRGAIGAVKALGDLVEVLASVGERLAKAEASRPPEPKPNLTDGELVAAIESLLSVAAAREGDTNVH